MGELSKPNFSIEVKLPIDRHELGTIIAHDSDGHLLFGPVEVDGKSDDAAAKENGNPDRHQWLPYGDTPTGAYDGSLYYEEDTPHHRRSYGQPDDTGKIPIIALQPLPGSTQAWRGFLNHRDGIAIHGGEENGGCEGGQLRPTHGCVRMHQRDIKALMLLVRQLGGEKFDVHICEESEPA